MVDKYYTPTIEEFHEGFEYEYSYCGGEWVKEKFTTSPGDIDCMAGDWYEFSPNCPKTACRVKCLDAADIEECGWEKLGSAWYNLKTVPGKLGYYLYVRIRIVGNDALVKAYRYDPQDNPDDIQEETTLFDGIILNKSELKKIMKMINIF